MTEHVEIACGYNHFGFRFQPFLLVSLHIGHTVYILDEYPR